MKVEAVTVEAMTEETGRSSDSEIEEILKMLHETSNVRIGDLQNPQSFGNNFRTMAKRRGYEVSISMSKTDKHALFITAKTVPAPKKKAKAE